MLVSLVALDYSRPVQPLLKQRPRIGTIHSVFQRAVNIAIDDTMVAVLSRELQRMPNALRLSQPNMRGLLSGLHPGMQVCIGDGGLFIPALHVAIHLPARPPWEPKPYLAQHPWRRDDVAHHIRTLARHLSRAAHHDGLAPLVWPLLLEQPAQETPLTRMALPMLQLLASAARTRSIPAIETATQSLAGLGPGLTPSGDDALAGYASVMALLGPLLSGDSGNSLPGTSIAAAIATTAQPRTNMLSATLLAHAARGEVAEHVGTLFTALALPAGAAEAVLRAADRLLAFGGTSGGDTMLGLLIGLRTLLEEKGAHRDDFTVAAQA